MIIVLILIIGFIVAVVLGVKRDTKLTQNVEKIYPNYDIESGHNYYVCIGKENIIFVPKNSINNTNLHTKVQTIDEIEVYQDGKSKSAGKALVGGITFGLLGAIVGASIKTEYVTNLGLRIYTGGKCFDLPELYSKTKRDSATYRLSIDHLNRIRAKLLPYQK